ncbi:molybdenum cofactor guanylyltransferase [Chamaesiphon sp. VAR_48_metabat_403]|uniref:molybdenum cofactor guanylyltransferase n=1 Tax=Chamaesiphon sp. VAR_48_metabat_403 TaxID=2964700 RepID=UPI00286DBF2D|nr:molybdenum cofactor guanylyltransferase [Chamaesiphon sp. VAR_48_metabat_403]
MPTVSALILAGGRSRRMGKDKATIEIDGVPMLRRIYDAIAACQNIDSIYVVTPWAHRYEAILPVTCNFILERPSDLGPTIALSQALTVVHSTWVLTLACDLPNLSTPFIQAGIDALPSIPAQSMAYLPKHEYKGWEPLCGFYRQICCQSLALYIEAGGRSLQGWLKQQVVTELVVTEPMQLVNCNTPADLESVVTDFRSVSP